MPSVIRKRRSYPSLRAWRLSNELSQVEAASELGVTQSYYSRLESGTDYPGRELAKTIIEKTGVPIETVMGVA